MSKKIFEEITAERKRQDAKWGEQNHPSTPPYQDPSNRCAVLGIPSEKRAKLECNAAANRGILTFGHIAVEELSEAVSAPDDEARRGELVQLAAVLVQWIETIDRRKEVKK